MSERTGIDRRYTVKFLLEDRPAHLLALSGLGSSTWDLTHAGDNPLNFCFIGAMGQAAPFALGLAMSQPERRVVLFTGDGELLMGLGALATIANRAPENLALLVMDNESYIETGGQPTATAGPTDFEMIAKGAGITHACTIRQDDELPALREQMLNAPGPFLAVVKVAAQALPLVFPHSFDGVTAINRFADAIQRSY
ncbi:MAG: aldehyde dehydrogenase [Gammaproteobacteria bacterium]|nr:aldehyde dehydrogenase [Gammaproteobacteria bacterium]